MADLQTINESGNQIDQMVAAILGTTLNELDTYVADVRNCFLNGQEILDDDLDKIILRMPVYIYNIIVFSQQIEMRKGVASEQASFAENEALLLATGTVQEKKAKAENQTAQDRMMELAYKTASSVVQRKIEGALSIYDAAKKIQQRRMSEKKLTAAAGSGVGTF